MAEINYEKAEKEVSKAVQDTTVKSLVEGKTVKSKRAMDYYGIKEDTPRPHPEDRVERLMSEMAAKDEEEEEEKKKKVPLPPEEKTPLPSKEPTTEEKAPPEEEEGEEEEEEFIIITKIPSEDTMKKARKQSARTPKRPSVQAKEPSLSEHPAERASPLLILRKHILWFKQLHMDDRYERLGTTQEEVFELRRARRLTDKELQRVIELNKRAEELKAEILKKHGKETLEEIVEKEKTRHKRKRLKTRESWIPL